MKQEIIEAFLKDKEAIELHLWTDFIYVGNISIKKRGDNWYIYDNVDQDRQYIYRFKDIIKLWRVLVNIPRQFIGFKFKWDY